jgi:hypothetical protein
MLVAVQLGMGNHQHHQGQSCEKPADKEALASACQAIGQLRSCMQLW